ncbi:Hypothetical predicted protein, partial [Drosophila guanche]
HADSNMLGQHFPELRARERESKARCPTPSPPACGSLSHSDCRLLLLLLLLLLGLRVGGPSCEQSSRMLHKNLIFMEEHWMERMDAFYNFHFSHYFHWHPRHDGGHLESCYCSRQLLDIVCPFLFAEKCSSGSLSTMWQKCLSCTAASGVQSEVECRREMQLKICLESASGLGHSRRHPVAVECPPIKECPSLTRKRIQRSRKADASTSISAQSSPHVPSCRIMQNMHNFSISKLPKHAANIDTDCNGKIIHSKEGKTSSQRSIAREEHCPLDILGWRSTTNRRGLK